MYKVRHKPTGKYAKNLQYYVFSGGRQYPLDYKTEGKVFSRKPNLQEAPEFELVRVAVIPEIEVRLQDWGFCFGKLQLLGLTVNQTYPNGYEVMDQIREAGLNVALVHSAGGYILLVDDRLFQTR